MLEHNLDTAELVRLEALRLANLGGGGHWNVLDAARHFEAYLTGADAKTPLEKITDALKEAGVK